MKINAQQEYIIGLDIGTGSAKAIALNQKGKVITVSRFYYPTNSPQPGYSEQDPEIIWQAFVNCIKEIVRKNKRLPITVSLSSCMHSLIVINKKNEAITPLLTWADTRSETIAEDIRNSEEAEDIYKATGTPIHSMSPLCKIKWLKENEKKIFASAFKFISIKEFIWYRLFNTYEVDASIASATGLFNINTFKWNEASLNLCGIKASALSEIVPTHFLRNKVNPLTASLLHITDDTTFCIGASDGCLANIGSYATEPGIAALTIGTSGAVRIACPKPLVNFSAMVFNYVLDDATFISGGPINNGGNVFKWLFKTFLNNANPSEKDYNDFFKNIETIPAASQGLLFLPYLYGERAPVWDEKASGMFFGIKSFHTNAHFLRAAVEGICFALKNILEIIEASAGSIAQLNVSGGFVNSATWMQILADISGKKICLVQTEDASSIGAALLGMKAIKLIDDYASLKPGMNTIILPNKKNKSVYEKNYGVYKKLYEPLKEFMYQLQKINN
ncbi:MAG: gluconokinase [Ginsengibacter sp.]